MAEFYHQLGHRFNWNLESLINDHVGDGCIIAPRYMKRDKVIALPRMARKVCIFDPQFFVPSSDRGELGGYEFFPEVISDGFSTAGYDNASAETSAEFCLQFQIENDFQYIVIPTRYRDGAPSDYIKSQSSSFIDPFLKIHSASANKKPLLLQLILNEHMLREESFRNQILNWVTGLEEIDGVYLIFQSNRTSKQIDDMELLIAMLTTIAVIRRNNLQVVVGYLNTEAIPLLVADPTVIATGSYENLRKFGLKPFSPEEEENTRGPKARIYVSKLCQWIDHNYLDVIRRVLPEGHDLFDDSPYRTEMFQPGYNWHFTKPQPYKHYFFVFSKQIKQLSENQGADRFYAVYNLIEESLREFEKLHDLGIVFSRDSDSSHLATWLTALNVFRREYGESFL